MEITIHSSSSSKLTDAQSSNPSCRESSTLAADVILVNASSFFLSLFLSQITIVAIMDEDDEDDEDDENDDDDDNDDNDNDDDDR